MRLSAVLLLPVLLLLFLLVHQYLHSPEHLREHSYLMRVVLQVLPAAYTACNTSAWHVLLFSILASRTV
jgi:hypothetical protein